MLRLLIQACSGRKIATERARPAIDVYDGTAFRVIKKFQREKADLAATLQILILSAEYGLIAAESEIEAYDRRMNQQRALELSETTARQWQAETGDKSYESIFINVGKDYRSALDRIVFPAGSFFGRGGIGSRNGQLKAWLNQQI